MKSLPLFKLMAVLLIILVISSCQPPAKKLSAGEGFINVPGGKVWYRVVGEGDKIPIVMLHGGPGVPSYYLNPMAALGKDRSIIFFDQLGCGRSDKITDTALMTTEHFVEELRQVIQHFGLKEFYLYGQSWGTMLATDFYLAHPDGIKGIMQSSPAISIPMWLADADTLIATLPDSIQEAIRVNEEAKTYDNPAYQNAMRVYYENFLVRKLPWPKDVDSAFAQTGTNVYQYMGGPSEFTMTGPLKDYDRTGRLKEIKVPVLYITGEFDEARPQTVQYYQSLTPEAQFALIPGAGHMTMQDNPEQSIKVVEEFLAGLEKK